MLKKTIGGILCFVLLLILYGPVSAQVRPGTISVTPYVGGFLFDNDQKLNNAPVYGLHLGYDFTKYLGMGISVNYISTDYNLAVPDSKSSNVNNLRVEGILNLLPDYRLVPFIAVGYGDQLIDYPKGVANKGGGAFDYGAGLKFFITDWLALRADVRQIFTPIPHQSNYRDSINWEYSLGLSFLFGGTKAPSTLPSGPQTRLSDPIGLSAAPVSDSQNDLVWNAVTGATGYKIYRDGAYLTASPTISLSDVGLKAGTRYCYHVSAMDGKARESGRSNQACATTLATMPPAQTPIGLSATPASESQIDLVWKEVAGTQKYNIYRDGAFLTSAISPSLSDNGLKAGTQYCYVVTALDAAGKEAERSNQACATTLATLEEQKQAAAAAVVAKEMFEKGQATIDIEFDYDKAVVKKKYHNEIRKFADVMKAYPDLKVVIQGHTDNSGGKGYNLKLSQKRAASVKDYMVKKFNIEGARLKVKGYGMSKPIASNKTVTGRQKNRRVVAAVDYMAKK